MNELVIMHDQQAVTTSLQVAENFGKEIRNVNADIKNLTAENPAVKNFFHEGTYENSRGREYPMYYMNRDGFTLLAMGFTGKDALQFKLKYINAFNAMEEKLNKPMSQLEIMQMQIAKMVEQEKQLTQLETRTSAIEQKQNDITEILSLNPTEWKKKVNGIINAIAKSRGGFQVNYADVRNESYQHLEDRAKCRLSIRLTNKKSEMALNGASKSKIDKVSKMDVIADDSRLTEIYLAIVKELAIKYGVNLEVSA